MADTKMIVKLRESTGAGMVDCQTALTEANGDFDKAVDILRKKGEAKAAKKADRETKEGLISISKDGSKVAVVSVACETDFVARNEDFIKVIKEFSDKLLTAPVEEFKVWADARIKNELVVKIGENIKLVEARVYDNEPVIGYYLHSNRKNAAVVVLSAGTEEMAVNVGMQIVAMSPEYLKPEDVPVEVLNKEKEIYAEQLKKEGKPENIIEKIMAGKLSKYYEDVCLTKQLYIKDDKMTVEKYLETTAPGATIVKFDKFVL
jgi:elongation factor Ts